MNSLYQYVSVNFNNEVYGKCLENSRKYFLL